ncbi:MAG: cation transporter [Methylococcaceae bacterium]|nr:cation transporter [Methylococcaceae bacterium]MDD1616120.1 cation transporter [Methylococcaceae bacterium]OYV18559.1 MAG: heavy metal transport/detoxification protein [Methylococcaceae bacterium NSP1-2]
MTESVVLTVTGMKCGGCETNVKDKLQSVEGISAVTASFKNNEVIVEFDGEKVNLDAIKNVITQAGFTVE